MFFLQFSWGNYETQWVLGGARCSKWSTRWNLANLKNYIIWLDHHHHHHHHHQQQQSSIQQQTKQNYNTNEASWTRQSNIPLELRQATPAPSRCTAVWHVPKLETPQAPTDLVEDNDTFLESKLSSSGGSVSQFLLSSTLLSTNVCELYDSTLLKCHNHLGISVWNQSKWLTGVSSIPTMGHPQERLRVNVNIWSSDSPTKEFWERFYDQIYEYIESMLKAHCQLRPDLTNVVGRFPRHVQLLQCSFLLQRFGIVDVWYGPHLDEHPLRFPDLG